MKTKHIYNVLVMITMVMITMVKDQPAVNLLILIVCGKFMNMMKLSCLVWKKPAILTSNIKFQVWQKNLLMGSNSSETKKKVSKENELTRSESFSRHNACIRN